MFMFGVGNGRLTRKEIVRRQAAAEKHDAQFVCTSGRSGHCVCGYGCRLDACPVKHYYFECANMGEPFNRQTAEAVLAELEK